MAGKRRRGGAGQGRRPHCKSRSPRESTRPAAKQQAAPRVELEGDLDRFLAEKATAIRALGKRAAGDIIAMGRHLIEAKDRAGHGKFLRWLRDDLHLHEKQAERLMAIAAAFSKFDIVSNLNGRDSRWIDYTALLLLSKKSVPEAVRRKVNEAALQGQHMTRAEAERQLNMTDAPPRPSAGTTIKTKPIPQRPVAPTPKMIDVPERPPAGPIKTTPMTEYRPAGYHPRPLIGERTNESLDRFTAAAEAYADAIERADVSALSREQARVMLQLLDHTDAASANLRRAITPKGKKSNGAGLPAATA
jgi:hypothetical protein